LGRKLTFHNPRPEAIAGEFTFTYLGFLFR
jgi:hypothetical protein